MSTHHSHIIDRGHSEKETMMPKISTSAKGAGNTKRVRSDADSRRSAIEQMGRTLDEWRAKIDELMVQLDLANLDNRDEISKRFDTTQKVNLGAIPPLQRSRRRRYQSQLLAPRAGTATARPPQCVRCRRGGGASQSRQRMTSASDASPS